jgi:hypothetical protein
VARAHPAVGEASGQAPHAVDELRAGEPSAAWAGSDGGGGAAAAGEDPAKALRNVALAVARPTELSLQGLTRAARREGGGR